jgi:hypothetical protein
MIIKGATIDCPGAITDHPSAVVGRQGDIGAHQDAAIDHPGAAKWRR